MKSKFISLFPWSVALLCVGMSMFYQRLWIRAIDRNDSYNRLVKQRDSLYRSLNRKYDSIIKLSQPPFGSGKVVCIGEDVKKTPSLKDVLMPGESITLTDTIYIKNK